MNRIKQLRNEKGYTQLDLAKLLNISDRAVGYYENGERNVDNELIKELTKIFSCTSDFLLGLSNKRNPETTDELRIGLSKEDSKFLTEDDIEEIKALAQSRVDRRKNRK